MLHEQPRRPRAVAADGCSSRPPVPRHNLLHPRRVPSICLLDVLHRRVLVARRATLLVPSRARRSRDLIGLRHPKQLGTQLGK
jgi:hypothetical protein